MLSSGSTVLTFENTRAMGSKVNTAPAGKSLEVRLARSTACMQIEVGDEKHFV